MSVVSVWIRRGGVDWEVDEGTAEHKHLLATGGEVVPAPAADGKPPAKGRAKKAAPAEVPADDADGETLGE